MKKICSKCKIEKSFEEFYKDKRKIQKNKNRYRAVCKACSLLYLKKIRQKVLDAYGNKCVCCGETFPEFLTIEHKNNDGTAHRKLIQKSAGSHFYKWLVDNNFPKEDFELNCWNCNCSKGKYGYCPHGKETTVVNVLV